VVLSAWAAWTCRAGSPACAVALLACNPALRIRIGVPRVHSKGALADALALALARTLALARQQLHLLLQLPIQITGLVGPARIAGATALGKSNRHQVYSTNGARWTAVTPRTAASSRELLLRLAR
jgi:hypothetical protein